MTFISGNHPYCTHRYALFVSYLGSKYKGSQRLITRDQPGKQDTIQEALEWSLESFMPAKKCRVTASSRTDKGVHALMNCYTLPSIDFDLPTEKMKRLANISLMGNRHDIVVNEVLLVPNNFHPRKSAISREYIYRIAVFNDSSLLSQSRKHSPLDLMHLLPVTELYRVLPLSCFNLDRALDAINLLRGEHDFASFAFKQQDENDTIRDLEINLSQVEINVIDPEKTYPFSLYHLHFKSRAFLYNQVRRLVGAIISYATYQTIELSQIKYLLDNPKSKNWIGSMIIAEPWGLFLSRINFDKSALEGSVKTYEDKRKKL